MKIKTFIGFFTGCVIGLLLIFSTNGMSPAGSSGWTIDLGSYLNEVINPGNESPTLNMLAVFIVPLVLPVLLTGLVGSLIGYSMKRKRPALEN